MGVISVSVAEWASGSVAVLGGIAAVFTAVWKLSATVSLLLEEFRTRGVLVLDLKQRLEALERATPGVTPQPESKAVQSARNGAEKS